MPNSIKKVDIYEIIVEPCNSITWIGKFNFKPNAEDVATAIREDISELDPDDEPDMIDDLVKTLELVTYQKLELLGQVKIAGTYVGEINIALIRVFIKYEPMMTGLQ